MTPAAIVQKLWNYRNVLRDDGMSYGDYVETRPIIRAITQRQQREQQREIERQRWEAEKAERAREKAERRRINAEQDSREELSSIIKSWAEAKRIKEFFADAKRRISELSDDEKVVVLERLKQAREMIGGTDALQWFRSWKSPEER